MYRISNIYGELSLGEKANWRLSKNTHPGMEDQRLT